MGSEGGTLELEGVDGKSFFGAGSRTCRPASSPIRSTAATATWRLEDDRLSRAPATTISTGSAGTTSATRCRP